ncbi:MAG TPA: LysR family transcriptional regulator [Acidimicrobiales bacterium]|nr:LysR family transcriptional regulator [Acidimicrobiales bacterium]
MSRPDWLRTFVAVYRAGSVTEGARRRNLSQPAASQQLAGLERVVGRPLFVRGAEGVVPTARGRELYGEVSEALDRLESVLEGLDGGRLAERRGAVLRLGAVAEYVAAVVVPALAALALPARARFGPEAELIEEVAAGELDVALSAVPSARRALASVPVAPQPYVLVGPPALLPPARQRTPGRLGAWLAGRPWVAYSVELPMTRRMWQTVLGRGFGGELRLVAADRRVVADAVRAGIGFSLLPRYVCEEPMGRGEMVEILELSASLPAEPWFATCRQEDLVRTEVEALLRALAPRA